VEKNVKISILLDLYGMLLTETQRKAIREHYDEDLSFAEIGDNIGKTRQAVHDAVKKGVLALNTYEEKLRVMARYIAFEKDIAKIKDMVISNKDKDMILKELDKLQNLMEE
jgi:predicted DNA-binding protein YlxM (UPF0122 family)